MVKKNKLRIISAIIFILLTTIIIFGDKSFQGKIITPSGDSISMAGFKSENGVQLRAIKNQDNFHLLSIPIDLKSYSNYKINFKIVSLPGENIIVRHDLYSLNYDNTAQEVAEIYGMSALYGNKSITINSGDAPANANLRIFYSGMEGLILEKISIIEIPAWWVTCKIIFIFITLLLTLIYLLKFIKFVFNNYYNKSELQIILIIYFFAVIVRYSLYISIPYWSGDEYVYKSIASGIWYFGENGVLTGDMIHASVNIPNLLYPYLISPSFILKENFYFGVRLLNSLVINSAIFPVFFISKRYLNTRYSIIIAILSLMLPFIGIGAYATTEVLFYPLFIAFVYAVICTLEKINSVKNQIFLGILVGFLLNVRLTALVLLPAYFLILLIFLYKNNIIKEFISKPYWLISGLSTALTFIFIQYVTGVEVVGGFGLYSKTGSSAGGIFGILLNNPTKIFYLLLGHLTTLSIIYIYPITAIFAAFAFKKNRLKIGQEDFNLLVTASIFSLALIAFSLIFTISVSPYDLGGLYRWHSRYYFYCYPIIFIGGAVAYKNLISSQLQKLIISLIIIISIIASIYFIKFKLISLGPWFGSTVDNMDVQWIFSIKSIYWFYIATSILLVILWLINFYSSIIIFVVYIFFWMSISNFGAYLYTGATRGVSQAAIQFENATNSTISPPCGFVIAGFLGGTPGRFVVVGESYASIAEVNFLNPYIPSRTLIHVDKNELLDFYGTIANNEYLILNGDIHMNSDKSPLFTTNKCSVYEK